MSSEGHDAEEEVTATSIKKNKILFRPGKRIRNVLKLAEYKKVQ